MDYIPFELMPTPKQTSKHYCVSNLLISHCISHYNLEVNQNYSELLISGFRKNPTFLGVRPDIICWNFLHHCCDIGLLQLIAMFNLSYENVRFSITKSYEKLGKKYSTVKEKNRKKTVKSFPYSQLFIDELNSILLKNNCAKINHGKNCRTITISKPRLATLAEIKSNKKSHLEQKNKNKKLSLSDAINELDHITTPDMPTATAFNDDIIVKLHQLQKQVFELCASNASVRPIRDQLISIIDLIIDENNHNQGNEI